MRGGLQDPEPPPAEQGSTAQDRASAQQAAEGSSAAKGGEHEGSAAASSSQELVNRIKWATASEVDNFGYNVYRGPSEDGPFERINEEIIEGAGTTDLTSRYEFVDRTIDPHTAYWYYVESIAMDGTRERFTPVARVGPKLPGDAEEGSGDADAASEESVGEAGGASGTEEDA
ncbi:MAG: hypothetical protein GF393_12490 [Armatimonadia bacterium]|nr:hypothetical protein [Armatimonadia bacterium]